MEQQLEDHMRLPPPVTTNGNGNGNGNSNSNSLSAITAADSTPLHKPSHQQMHPAQQPRSHSISAALSPPFTTSTIANLNANTSALHGNGNGKGSLHQPLSSSSLSPRPFGPVPTYAPPSYAFSQQHNHDPSTLNFPDPPSTELAPLQLHAHAHEYSISSLPSLASLTRASTNSSRRFAPSSVTSDTSHSPPQRPRVWPTGNPYSAYYNGGHGHLADSPARMDIDSMSNGTRGPLSPDTLNGRASSVSLDDPDVRMAAEALGDLKADFVSSPRNRNTPLPTSPPNNHFGTPGPPEAEPLLSLVMTSGSLLAKPIEGTVSAYNTTKNFSPGFIKAPVEYVEGVVGSGLHLSGIEGGVRWFFRGKGRHPSSSDLEAGENSHKRRKLGGGSTSVPRRGGDVAPLTSTNGLEVDPYGFSDKDRRLSMSTVDTLPAYDDARSPMYTENAMGAPHEKAAMADGSHATPTTSRPSSTTPTAWQSRLIMSTSGLSIAMSEESLRSLKYCLSWLRWANEHIGSVISALKDALEKYDSQHPNSEDQSMRGAGEDPEQARRELGARISALRSDVLKTLQGVIETVSKYAGGALPDNARVLVRRHLTSLPQRFRLATQESAAAANEHGGSPGSSSSAAAAAAAPATAPTTAPAAPPSSEEGKEKEVREGAQRVLVLAKEGLDMMAQVSGVLDGTIVSAEEWCERLGRKKREEREQMDGQGQGQQSVPQQPQMVPFAGVGIDGDVKMG